MTDPRGTPGDVVLHVDKKIPVVVAFEKWWFEARAVLEIPRAMKFAAWAGWLAHSKLEARKK